MSSIAEWLARVLETGESVQTAPPARGGADPATEAYLRRSFDRHALDVAGPPVPFDPAAALGAAAALASACWHLATGGSDGEVGQMTPPEPDRPAAHLSADVCLRLLPAAYRRARALDPDGRLAADLERLLRAWPLSGVLADLDGGPATPPGFGGHPGLQLLYAERLAGAGRPGWVPPSGPAREWAERVFAERGRSLPPAAEEARA